MSLNILVLSLVDNERKGSTKQTSLLFYKRYSTFPISLYIRFRVFKKIKICLQLEGLCCISFSGWLSLLNLYNGHISMNSSKLQNKAPIILITLLSLFYSYISIASKKNTTKNKREEEEVVQLHFKGNLAISSLILQHPTHNRSIVSSLLYSAT